MWGITTTPIVLVPGFWLGAWAWDEVAAAVRADGHEVTAVTLPGLESADADRSSITFLASHAEPIHGDVVEIKDNAYTTRYGGTRVRSTTVLDIDPSLRQATLIADITSPRALPEAAFDAIVLTQALQFFTEPALAVTNCQQALRPGGSLLLTAPAVGRLSLSAPHADLWRVTPAGLGHLLASTWTGPVDVCGYGNLRACLAMLLGEAAEELTADERDPIDPSYPLVACAHARTV